eukprot:CFRG5744T1
MSSAVKEGKNFIGQAEKSMKAGFFKQADPQTAVGMYEKAALCFKKARAFGEAKSAFLKAANMHQQLDSGFHSARALENAGLMCKDNKEWDEAADLFSSASVRYREFGSNDTAGMTLEKGAKFLDNDSPGRAIDMYVQAADLYGDEEKFAQEGECYRKAAMLHLRTQKYDKAVALMELQAKAFQNAHVMDNVYKVYLSIIVVYLRMGDIVAAIEKADMWTLDGGWTNSEDSRYADYVIQAFNEGDQELMESVVKKQRFGYLDNEVAKIARSLRVPGAGSKKKKLAPTPPLTEAHAPINTIPTPATPSPTLASTHTPTQTTEQSGSGNTVPHQETNRDEEEEDEDDEGGLC